MKKNKQHKTYTVCWLERLGINLQQEESIEW